MQDHASICDSVSSIYGDNNNDRDGDESVFDGLSGGQTYDERRRRREGSVFSATSGNFFLERGGMTGNGSLMMGRRTSVRKAEERMGGEAYRRAYNMDSFRGGEGWNEEVERYIRG